jgi:hypothetical protein
VDTIQPGVPPGTTAGAAGGAGCAQAPKEVQRTIPRKEIRLEHGRMGPSLL